MKKRFNRYKFDVTGYVSDFDFCSKNEKICIAHLLRSIWKEYKPSVNDNVYEINTLRKTALSVNGHEIEDTELKIRKK